MLSRQVPAWQLAIAVSLIMPKTTAFAPHRRRENEFNFHYPDGCDSYCEDSAFRSCIPNGGIDYSCACSLSGLQDIANCASCAWQAPEGRIYVNGTSVGFSSFMSSWLDSCYDKGYVIASMDYSSVVAQATSATAAPSSISTSTPVSISSASPPSSSSSSVSSRQYNLTGGLSDLVEQDFTGGVCNFYYFSAISPEFGFCIGSGSAIFPSSGCSGTACTLDAAAPKLGWGLAGDLSLPSNLICDGSVRTVADGLDIPAAMTAGKGSDPFYACACNGPISSVPDICQGVCGAACETGLYVPSAPLSCNVAYRCSGGPSYNIRQINNDTCTVPKLVGITQGNVDYILDNDGLISCSGTSESVGSCPGSNPENTSGSRVCSCIGPASGVDTCSSGQNLSDSGSSNSTSDDSGSRGSSGTGNGGGNGSSSGSGSGSGGGSSGSSQNGATHVDDIFTVWGSAIVLIVSFIMLVTDL